MKVLTALLLSLSFAFSSNVRAEDEKVTELLRPAVRVRAPSSFSVLGSKANAAEPANKSAAQEEEKKKESEEPVGTGSGTVIYSEDREGTGTFQTFVLTNWHVVQSAIRIEKRWSNLQRRWIDTEANELCEVDLFDYAEEGAVVTKSTVKAEIVAWNQQEDMAVLKLRHPFQIKNVTRIIPPSLRLALFQETYAVGCPLGVEPVFTRGQITDLEFLIDTKEYTVSSAHIIWGNSGGALYAKFELPGKNLNELKEVWYMVGIPSRVSIGGLQAVTHLGYHITPKRIHNFLKDEELDFLIDSSPDKTPTKAMKRRGWIQDGKNPDEMEKKEAEEAQKKVLSL